jgi:hypothetical protein
LVNHACEMGIVQSLGANACVFFAWNHPLWGSVEVIHTRIMHPLLFSSRTRIYNYIDPLSHIHWNLYWISIEIKQLAKTPRHDICLVQMSEALTHEQHLKKSRFLGNMDCGTRYGLIGDSSLYTKRNNNKKKPLGLKGWLAQFSVHWSMGDICLWNWFCRYSNTQPKMDDF